MRPEQVVKLLTLTNRNSRKMATFFIVSGTTVILSAIAGIVHDIIETRDDD